MPPPLNNLAGLYGDIGKHAQAEPLYKESLAIVKKTLGENHLDYATFLTNMAHLYNAIQNYPTRISSFYSSLTNLPKPNHS
jgi:tetratricopeptide (TPR) repeat protein